MTSQSTVSVPFLPLKCTVTLEGFREVIGCIRAFNCFTLFNG